MLCDEGHVSGLQSWWAHIHSDIAVLFELTLDAARTGLEPDSGLGGQAPVSDESDKTPGAVAALLSFGAVGVEYSIPEIRLGVPWRLDSEQLIKANPLVPVGELTNLFSPQPDILGDQI